MNNSLAPRRLASQQIAQPNSKTPAEVVAWLGAVQAQDYLGALWAVIAAAAAGAPGAAGAATRPDAVMGPAPHPAARPGGVSG